MNSRPAVRVLLPLIAGIIIAHYWHGNFGFLVVTGCGCVTVAVLLFSWGYRRKRWRVFLGMILLFLLGYWRMATMEFRLNNSPIHSFLRQHRPVILQGQVQSDPEIRGKRLQFVLETRKIVNRGKIILARSKVLVKMRRWYDRPAHGDYVWVRGKLRRPPAERNPGEFNYRAYLRKRHILGILYAASDSSALLRQCSGGSIVMRWVVLPVKHYLSDCIESYFGSTEEAFFLQGLLIGMRGQISSKIRESFSRAGVVHVLAVSGLHVGLILLIFLAIAAILRLPFAARTWLTLTGLLFYAAITGFNPPVTRASIMAAVILLGTLLERETDIYNLLAFAALIILIYEPMAFFQLSFQLSFLAIWGIVYFYPKLQDFLPSFNISGSWWKSKIQKAFLPLLLVSVAAQLGTLPLVVHYFGRFSLVATLANLLVVPAVGLIVALGFVTIFASLFGHCVGLPFANLLQLIMKILFAIVTKLSLLPWASISVWNTSWYFFVSYFLVVMFIVNLKKPKIAKIFLLGGLLWIAVLLGMQAIRSVRPVLRVTFLDVGQGDAAFIHFPSGQTLLIDGGPASPQFDTGRRILVPYLKRQNVDTLTAVLVTHEDNDHVGGVASLIQLLPTRSLYIWEGMNTSDSWKNCFYAARQRQVSLRTVHAGCFLPTSNSSRLLVLHPPPENQLKDRTFEGNNGSLVVKLIFGKVSFLFTGDIEDEAEKILLRYGDILKSDVLKVPHHGSVSSSTLAFLQAVQPRWAVISVGEWNRFGQPSPVILERLSQLHIQVLRTDENGAIIFETDGNRIWKVR